MPFLFEGGSEHIVFDVEVNWRNLGVGWNLKGFELELFAHTLHFLVHQSHHRFRLRDGLVVRSLSYFLLLLQLLEIRHYDAHGSTLLRVSFYDTLLNPW